MSLLVILIDIYKKYLVGIIVFYIIISVFTILYNAITNKKFSIISLIPLFNIYQLGQLVINYIIGWIYVFGLLLIVTLTSFMFKTQYLPLGYKSLLNGFTIVYLVIIGCTIIYGLIKLFIKDKKDNEKFTKEMINDIPIPFHLNESDKKES